MTIKTAKDKAAQKHGYYDWENFLEQTMLNHPQINIVTTTAMRIYFESKNSNQL